MKTAVEWLFDKLWDTPKDKFEWYAILKEAEKKFEDDVTEAFNDGQWDWCEATVNGTEPKEPKQYYNETFGVDKRNKTD